MGRHLAISLARRGHDVCGADQNEKALSELHEIEPGITTCKLDVRSEVDWKNALQMCKERFNLLFLFGENQNFIHQTKAFIFILSKLKSFSFFFSTVDGEELMWL